MLFERAFLIYKGMFLHKSPHWQALEKFKDNRIHLQRLAAQQDPFGVHPQYASCTHHADTCGIVNSVDLRTPSLGCHPFPSRLCNTGQGSEAFFHINGWFKASSVGGSPSKLFFSLRNVAALSILIRASLVPRLQSWQTKASALERTSPDRYWSSPRCSSSRANVAKVLHADCFPIPANGLVVSQPMMAWKACGNSFSTHLYGSDALEYKFFSLLPQWTSKSRREVRQLCNK